MILKVQITWQASTSEDVDYYSLERSINGGDYEVIQDNDNLSYTDYRHEDWETVRYRIKAVSTVPLSSEYIYSPLYTVPPPIPETAREFAIKHDNEVIDYIDYNMKSIKLSWEKSDDLNLFTENDKKFESWNGYGGATLTKTQNVSMPEWGTTEATRIRSSGGNASFKMAVTVPTLPGSSTFSMYIKNNSSTPISIGNGDFFTIQPNETKLHKNTAEWEHPYVMIVIGTNSKDVDLDVTLWRPILTRDDTFYTHEIERSFNDGIFQNVKTTTGLTHIEEVDCWTNVQYRIRAISPYNKYSPFAYKKYTVNYIKEEHGILQPFGLKVDYAESRFDVTPTLRERVATAAGVDGEYYFGSDFEPKLFDYVTWTKGVFSEEDKKKLKDKIATVFACFRYGALNLVRENRVHKVSPIAKADIINYPLHLDVNLGFKASPIGHSLVENQEYGKSEYINNGNETTFPTIILKGELVNPSFKVNGKIYNFSTQVAIADGDIVTIDCKTRTVVLTNSQGDTFNYLGAWNGEFPTFKVGVNTFDTGDIPAENIIVRWYDTWV